MAPDPANVVSSSTRVARWFLKPLGLWAKQSVDRHDALPNGFPRIAAFIASDPDHVASVYKRFNALNVRNLLLLEARVAALEDIQRQLDIEDAEKLQEEFETNFQLQTTSASFEYFALLGNSSASSDQQDPYRDIYSLDTIPKYAFKVWNKKYLEDAARWQRNNSTPEELNYDCVAEMEEGYFRKRWEVAKAIQYALKEYQEAVVLQAKMLDLENPTKRTTKALKAFLGGDESKNHENRTPKTVLPHPETIELRNIEEGIQQPAPKKEPSLNRDNQGRRPMQFRDGSAAWHLLDDKNDLLSLHPPGDDDYGTKIVSKLFGWLLQRRGTGDPEFGDVSEEAVSRFTTIWTFLVAIGFLMGAVWLLWRVGLDFVSSDSDLNHDIVFERKLGITTAFTAVFGAWVAMFTSARRYEIFGATAAYAAVLIVFIGAAPGNT